MTKAEREAELAHERERGRQFALGQLDAYKERNVGSAAERIADVRAQIQARPLHRTTRLPVRFIATKGTAVLEFQQGKFVRYFDLEVDHAPLDALVSQLLERWPKNQRPLLREWKSPDDLWQQLEPLGIALPIKDSYYKEHVLPVAQLVGRELASIKHLIEATGPEVVIHEGPAPASAA